MTNDIPENDAEGETLSQFVGALVGSGGVNAAHLGEQPSSGSVDSLLVLLGSSGHRILSQNILLIKLIN